MSKLNLTQEPLGIFNCPYCSAKETRNEFWPWAYREGQKDLFLFYFIFKNKYKITIKRLKIPKQLSCDREFFLLQTIYLAEVDREFKPQNCNCVRGSMQSHARMETIHSLKKETKKLRQNLRTAAARLMSVCWALRGYRQRIAPAIDDMLSPATRGEEANTPHQSAPMDRKGKGLVNVS